MRIFRIDVPLRPGSLFAYAGHGDNSAILGLSLEGLDHV